MFQRNNVFSTATLALTTLIIATIPTHAQEATESGPRGVVVNPRTNKAYALHPDLGTVSVNQRRHQRRHHHHQGRPRRQVHRR